MFRTSTWTNALGHSERLAAPELMPDFDNITELDPIPATGMSHAAMDEKPYIYGRHAAQARAILERWNQQNAHDPAPM